MSLIMNFQIFLFFISLFCNPCHGKSFRLEKLNVDPNLVTISGFSSGGAQAMQFHISHSSKLLGAGIFSGVPYMYGHDRNREDFIVNDPDNFNISVAVEYAKKYEEQGLVDALEHLKNSRVYIYHGTRDSTVYHGSGKAIEKIYSVFNPTIMTHLDTLQADHGMPSDNSGGPCGMVNLGQYLVNNCNYSGVFEMFNHLYGGDLIKPIGTVGSVSLAEGQFYSFDQSEFFDGKLGFFSKSASMDPAGFIYVPSGCSTKDDSNENENGTLCKLAFALHGCAQSRQTYGDKFARTTGYLEVAELNEIIVIFPQTRRTFYNPRNPSGCWDWMGFTGKEYATQNALQIKVLRKMMSRVLGEDDGLLTMPVH